MNIGEKITGAIRSLNSGYDNSAWWRMQFASRVLSKIHKISFRDSDRVHILDADWNNLFVLDACRPDLFSEVADLSRFDSYEVQNSLGSGTHEWTKRNFCGPAAGDVIYVTASPVVSRNLRTAVFHLEEIWKTDFDAELGTVPADPVIKRAKELREIYPDKRIILHFLQPHYPFVNNSELQFTSFRGTNEFNIERSSKANDVWEALGMGIITREECWNGYKRNLEYVLDKLLPELAEFEGRSVITSDHGNLLGERPRYSPMKIYGHPNGIRHPNLSTVPWAIIEDDSKGSGDSNSESELSVEEKLEALGYV